MFILHIHTSSLHHQVGPQHRQHWKSLRLSTLLMEGSLSVQWAHEGSRLWPLLSSATLTTVKTHICLNAAHTGPADIIPLWGLWFNLTGPLFHHTQQSESTLTYRSLLMLSLPPMSPFIWSLLLPRARPSKERARQVGGAATCTRPGTSRHIEDLWSPEAR